MAPLEGEPPGMTESRPARQVHALVTGVVQGVGFRYFVADAARRAGAVGWVRNLRDGRVELVAEGPEAAVRALLDEVRAGPPGSRVEALDAQWHEACGDFTGFRLERTV